MEKNIKEDIGYPNQIMLLLRLKKRVRYGAANRRKIQILAADLFIHLPHVDQFWFQFVNGPDLAAGGRLVADKNGWLADKAARFPEG